MTERLEDRMEEARTALVAIDKIRNSIIGTQTINWSEHIYPLVAALEAAGYEGESYEKAREDVGTLIDRTNAAEGALTALKQRVDTLFAAIQHGDDAHRAWLWAAVAAHFSGGPVPSPKGDGRRAEVVKAARAFDEKVRAVEEAGGLSFGFVIAHVHGMNYEGPNFGEEWKALTEALARHDGVSES